MIAGIKKYALLNSIKKVLVGLSGGSDSCCLLTSLREAGVETIALHCNFNLRGEESIRDRDFVVALCSENQIPLKTIEFDVDKYMKSHKGISLEMACRELRYEWFFSMMSETKADRLTIGHNADDNIETFFINLLRGSGTNGLKGMEYDNGTIWRPLLPFHKKTILEFLKEKNIDYITDSTNLQSDYRRNFLRNEIIPLIKSEWKGFDKAMDKSISNLKTENLVIEKTLSEILKKYPNNLPIEVIKDYPAPLLLIKRFISPLKPYSTTADEVLSSIHASKPNIPKWNLPKGSLIIRKGHLTKIDK